MEGDVCVASGIRKKAVAEAECSVSARQLGCLEDELNFYPCLPTFILDLDDNLHLADANRGSV